MTGLQRVLNTFNGQPVDRLPVSEDFWGETLAKWVAEGHMRKGESPVAHFNLDLDRAGLLNSYANPAHGWRTLEETETIVLMQEPNGATTRSFKNKAGGLEHVAYLVRDRESWESFAKPHLEALSPERIPFEHYRNVRADCIAANRHFSNDAFGPFEMMQRILGHESLLMNMALEPEWMQDMVQTYCEFNIRHWDELFHREGLPQATWIAEDLGYKLKPFMSIPMFEKILLPAYARMFQWLHEKGLKVIMHSCGYVEPCFPLLCDAGLDCLEGLEAKAGMDLPGLFHKLGNRLVWYGNIDIRALEANDHAFIDRETEKLLRVTSEGGRCMVHSDHSISPFVAYDTYRYFLDAVALRSKDGT